LCFIFASLDFAKCNGYVSAIVNAVPDVAVRESIAFGEHFEVIHQRCAGIDMTTILIKMLPHQASNTCWKLIDLHSGRMFGFANIANNMYIITSRYSTDQISEVLGVYVHFDAAGTALQFQAEFSIMLTSPLSG
jgi:hypothetical protein